jgi:molecular chaperone GrpE
MMRALLFVAVQVLVIVAVQGWVSSRPPVFGRSSQWARAMCTGEESVEGNVVELVESDDADINSQEIARLSFKIEEAKKDLASAKADIVAEKEQLKALDEEYGPEITRVKKEFTRMKERSVEEAIQISDKAKADGL